MVYFENENIIKLIFTSIHCNIFTCKVMNKTVYKIMIQLSSYKTIFKAIGKTQIIIEEHLNTVTSLCRISDQCIVSASKDETIKVWDIEYFQCIKTLQHPSAITTVTALPNDQFVSCCHYCIKVWNIKNDFKCIYTISHFPEYKNYNSLISLPDNDFAVCAGKFYPDKILILDSKDSYSILKVIDDYWGTPKSLVSLNFGRIAYAAWGNAIKIWAKKSYKFLWFEFFKIMNACKALVVVMYHK
jgi:WD40 repeat protein